MGIDLLNTFVKLFLEHKLIFALNFDYLVLSSQITQIKLQGLAIKRRTVDKTNLINIKICSNGRENEVFYPNLATGMGKKPRALKFSILQPEL